MQRNFGPRTLGAALLVAVALVATRLPPSPDVPEPREWTFIYVMGYDNDLDEWGQRILARIEDGVRTTGGPAIAEFRREVPGEVELVFLQQCGRATVENLYNFRGAARAVMASQTWVGVPNSYYAALFRWLDEQPAATGAEVAETIAYEDHDFTNYVAEDGDRLADLPAALAPAIAALTADAARPARRPEGVPTCFVCRIRTDERVHDLLAWMDAAARADGLDPSGPDFAGLRRFVTEDLIVLHRKNPAKAPEIPDFTGLGILVPPTTAVADRHRDYPLYREVPGLPLAP